MYVCVDKDMYVYVLHVLYIHMIYTHTYIWSTIYSVIGTCMLARKVFTEHALVRVHARFIMIQSFITINFIQG